MEVEAAALATKVVAVVAVVAPEKKAAAVVVVPATRARGTMALVMTLQATMATYLC